MIFNIPGDDPEQKREVVPNRVIPEKIYDSRIKKIYIEKDLTFRKDPEALQHLCNSDVIFMHPRADYALGVEELNLFNEDTLILGGSCFTAQHRHIMDQFAIYKQFRDLPREQQVKILRRVDRRTQERALYTALLMSDLKNAKLVVDQIDKKYYREQETLMVLTDVPDGTLGDASAASSALKVFANDEKYKKMRHVWVIRESNGRLKVRDMIPEHIDKKDVIEIKDWVDMLTHPRVISLLLSGKTNAEAWKRRP